MAKEFKVGEAPWEVASAPKEFAVGQAPWEVEGEKHEASAPPASQSQTALEHFGNGASFGYLPQLQALAEPITNWIGNKVTGANVESDDYLKARDSNVKRLEKEAQDNPWTAGLSNVAGGVTTGIATSGLMPNSGAVSVMGKAGDAAKLGAIYGGITNPGDKEGEFAPLQLGDRVMNAGKGMLTGALAEGGLNAAAKIPAAMQRSAGRSAFKSLGPYARDAMKAHAKGDVENIGQSLIDNKVIGWMPSSYETLAKRAATAEKSAGSGLGKYIEELNLKAPNTTLDRNDLVSQVKKHLLNPNEEIPGVAAKNQRISDLIGQFESGAKGKIGIGEAEGLKKSVGKEITWDRLPGADIPLDEQVNRSLYGKLMGGVENTARRIEGVGEGIPSKFEQMKDNFGNLKTASEIANRKEAREMAKRTLSPSDYFTGVTGAATGFASGDGLEDKLKRAGMGASLGLANKFSRTYGPQVMAKSMSGLSGAMMKSPSFARLAQENPKAFQSAVSGMAKKMGIVGDSALKAADSTPQPDDIVSEDEAKQKFIEGN